MLIHPDVVVTPDYPTIRFRQPREQVDLNKELPRILQAQGWGCGTYFHVQFFSHDKTRLIASTRFVVTEEVELITTSEDQYRPITKTVFNRKCAQVDPWWECGNSAEVLKTESEKVDGVLLVSWNPGKKLHQVKSGDKVVFESSDKQEAIDFSLGKLAKAA